MNTERTPSDQDFYDALATQYRAAVSMLTLTNTRRTATARFYITLVSGLVGLITLVLRPEVDMETQVWTTSFICFFSILLSLSWYISIRALRNTAEVQRSLLGEMEKMLPFAFVTRQEQYIADHFGWLNSGRIEQQLPLIMMVPPLLILLYVHLG